MARTPRAPRSQTAINAAASAAPDPKGYRHKEEAAARPEAGAAPRFKDKKPPATYRYDSSLSPALDWDQQPAREVAAWLLARIEEAAALPGQTFPERRVLTGADGKPLVTVAGLQDALTQLKAMQKPFLNWAGKAERLSFEVPTLPLFIHERLSTEAIIKTLEGHRKAADQSDLFSLFSDERMPMAKQVDAYAYRNGWVNRMVLGDSLSVMNSLLRYDGLGGQVQMIYMDPPYGVKFGSNFQPFVRKRDVKHGDDEDMTREPEMVQAYRDTWELGLHSYLTYLRDRLMVAKDLLTPSGSIFVQISDDNLHYVREVLEEVFGASNFIGLIQFKKTGGQSSSLLPSVADYIVWFAKDAERIKYRPLFLKKTPGDDGAKQYTWVELSDGARRPMDASEQAGRLPDSARIFQPYPLVSMGPSAIDRPFRWNGRDFHPSPGRHWSVTAAGLEKLAETNRLLAQGNTLRFVNYLDDYPVTPLTNIWTDTQTSGFAADKLYVVQTLPKVV